MYGGKEKVRNEGRRAAEPQLFNSNSARESSNHSSPNSQRACEARAAVDTHFLHSFGEHKVTKVTCGRGRNKESDKRRMYGWKVSMKVNMRNEGRRAAFLSENYAHRLT